jgi:sulfatase maturation enzyme AslB (radical SAM superfamily)
MVTNRCNLKCSYCVLEDSPLQLKSELDLKGKKELITHLYQKLGFRRLTLSGGEVLIIGKSAPHDFLELIRHIRQFKFSDPAKNLEIELYTNGAYLNEHVASEMVGVVDLVAVTIDSSNNDFLSDIGRNTKKFNNYYHKAIQVCGLLSSKGIAFKLHSVVGLKNYLTLPDEVASILSSLRNVAARPLSWKFYQYMSYDAPELDCMHVIGAEAYRQFQNRVESALVGQDVRLHFKDNEEMNSSLFNILSYGTAQYMKDGDTWLTSRRTQDLRSYGSMPELFAKTDIDEHRFRLFHEMDK